VLTPYDDFPIHQTADPVAHPSSADPNHYDRYFFNGFSRNGELFFAGAMAHYPNRGLIDAAFSVVIDGVEHSVFASGSMPLDRATEIGPIRVEVLDPLRRIRLSVAPNDYGLEADIVFDARTVAIEEPRNTAISGTRRVMDVTRLTQWGSWEGTIRLAGSGSAPGRRRPGVRDRSWGQRGLGVQAPTNFPQAAPQVFWLWAPLHFDTFCTHLALFERSDGERWLEQALILPVIDPETPTWGENLEYEHLQGVDYELDWIPGTRIARSAVLTMRSAVNGTARSSWSRSSPSACAASATAIRSGVMGPCTARSAVGGESIRLDEFDPRTPPSMHVQTLCRATMDGEEGIGVLEQIAFGDHTPTGLARRVRRLPLRALIGAVPARRRRLRPGRPPGPGAGRG
jgi:hypothetical protein